MPTRPKKGSTPEQGTTGSSERGGQKAVTGSTRSADVAGEAKRAAKAGEASAKVVVNHEEQVSPVEE